VRRKAKSRFAWGDIPNYPAILRMSVHTTFTLLTSRARLGQRTTQRSQKFLYQLIIAQQELSVLLLNSTRGELPWGRCFPWL